MSDYTEALDKEGWSKHYNVELLEKIVKSIEDNNVQVWAEEMCNIVGSGESCLEIGCGSGATSLWLAKNNRKVTALDYTESSIALIEETSERLGLDVNAVLADATIELPFKEKEFGYIFQVGLLEHFSTEKQIELLKLWSKYCKTMVSMIPNASSVPYRLGKEIKENAGTWAYGLETPKHSLASEFTEAGIKVEKEYTIGTDWALRFLDKKHPLRKMFEKMLKNNINLDEYMQGYLLVTIGRCE